MFFADAVSTLSSSTNFSFKLLNSLFLIFGWSEGISQEQLLSSNADEVSTHINNLYENLLTIYALSDQWTIELALIFCLIIFFFLI